MKLYICRSLHKTAITVQYNLLIECMVKLVWRKPTICNTKKQGSTASDMQR